MGTPKRWLSKSINKVHRVQKMTFFLEENDLGPQAMSKQVFLARFELVVARCGPPKIPKCLLTGLNVLGQKDLSKLDQKFVFPKMGPRPFGVPEQVN